MQQDLKNSLAFLFEIDRLKSVNRRVYIGDNSRPENSAEHSWHIALALWTLSAYAPPNFQLEHAIKLALLHDLGEIDPGDISIFAKDRSKKHQAEQRCMERLANINPSKANELMTLWNEYEAQQSLESQWVKIVDRLLPFLLNMANEGRAWQEQGVTRSQVLEINQINKSHFPELYQWLLVEIKRAVKQGWLIDQ